MRLSAVVVVAAVLTAACSPSPDLTGERLYEVSCAGCHGADLGGGVGPAIGPGSNSENLTDRQLRGVIEVGPGAMPGYGNSLSPAQIDSLVAYLATELGR